MSVALNYRFPKLYRFYLKYGKLIKSQAFLLLKSTQNNFIQVSANLRYIVGHYYIKVRPTRIEITFMILISYLSNQSNHSRESANKRILNHSTFACNDEFFTFKFTESLNDHHIGSIPREKKMDPMSNVSIPLTQWLRPMAYRSNQGLNGS